jgi:hypothetical protein
MTVTVASGDCGHLCEFDTKTINAVRVRNDDDGVSFGRNRFAATLGGKDHIVQ